VNRSEPRGHSRIPGENTAVGSHQGGRARGKLDPVIAAMRENPAHHPDLSRRTKNKTGADRVKRGGVAKPRSLRGWPTHRQRYVPSALQNGQFDPARDGRRIATAAKYRGESMGSGSKGRAQGGDPLMEGQIVLFIVVRSHTFAKL